MACSSDFEEAQIPKPCELCEAQTNIKLKCIECCKFICEGCRKIHRNVPTLAYHQIVEVSSANIDMVKTKAHIDAIPCSIHSRKFHCLFCKSCDRLICAECVSGPHAKHDFESINEAYDKKISKLEALDQRIQNEISDLKQTADNFEKSKQKWASAILETLTLVDTNERDIHENVKKYAEKVRNSITKKNDTQTESFEAINKQIKEKESKLEKDRETINNVLKSHQGAQVFNTASDIDDFNTGLSVSVSSLPVAAVGLSLPDLSTKIMKEIFGRFSYVSTLSKVNFELVNRMNSSISCIDKMITSGDADCFWISAFDCGKDASYLTKIKLSSNTTKTQKANIDVFDMALMDDKVLISVHMTSEIRCLTQNGKSEICINVSPSIARGIHVTKEKEILVGVRDDGDPYLMTNNSCRKILVYGSDYQLRSVYEYDVNNQRLFTLPRRIITNACGDIIVSDSTAKDEGRLVAFGRRADKKWTFEEKNLGFALETAFDPDDIVSTTSGYIIVSDETNHTLFVLSPVGDLLAYKDLTQWQIYFPRSVCVDADNKIWLGCCTSYLRKADEAKKKRKDYTVFACIKLVN